MKIFQSPEGVQMFGQIIIQASGQVIMIAVIVALISVWALTELFYELGRRIACGGKLKTKQIKN